MKHRQSSGFTLLEVLVALMVLAVGLTAAILTSIEITRNTDYLRHKTFAHWIGENIIAERSLSTLAPAERPQKGTVTMIKQNWQWQVTIRPTDNDNIQQITVDVSQGRQLYATNTSFEYLPTEKPNA